MLCNPLHNIIRKNCLTGGHEIEPVHAADTNAGSMAHLTSFMITPTTAELRTAIEILKKLDERLNDYAAHSVMQLPDTDLGDRYAEQIEARTVEQTSHIERVVTQLQNWREELLEQQKNQMTQSV
jgi:hypothetical protein